MSGGSGPHQPAEADARTALVRAATALERTGNVGTSGNLSLRRPDGLLITPSGVPYDRLVPADLVAVDWEGEVRDGGRPSSEWRIHRDIYRARREAGAVVHAHSPHATALSCLRRPIPAFHYEVAFAGGPDIRCAGYATFGTQALSDHVLEALANRRACLMANHGLVCFGAGLDEALALAEKVEQLARIFILSLAVGEPEVLDAVEMDRVQALFADYGASAGN